MLMHDEPSVIEDPAPSLRMVQLRRFGLRISLQCTNLETALEIERVIKLWLIRQGGNDDRGRDLS